MAFGSKLEGDFGSKLEGDFGSKFEGDFGSKLKGDHFKWALTEDIDQPIQVLL